MYDNAPANEQAFTDQKDKDQNNSTAQDTDANQNGKHKDAKDDKNGDKNGKKDKGDFIWRIHHHFNELFERFRDRYCTALTWALTNRGKTSLIFVVFFLLSFCLLPFIGKNFFPNVDAGLIRLHIRAPAGTRLEETEHLFSKVEAEIRKTIPPGEIDTVIDNIGLPVGGVNLAFSDISTIGSLDGDMLISLKEKHGPTETYTEALRHKFAAQFPDTTFQFLPADITTQILNFGLPAPIDIQVAGRDPGDYAVAQQIVKSVRKIPGAVDVVLHQVVNAPQININVDRTRAGLLGLTERDAANNLLLSLTGNAQSAPSFFVDYKNGASYNVTVQSPQRNIQSVADIINTPVQASAATPTQVTSATATTPQLLSNLADVQHTQTPQVINHYNVQPTSSMCMSVRQDVTWAAWRAM